MIVRRKIHSFLQLYDVLLTSATLVTPTFFDMDSKVVDPEMAKEANAVAPHLPKFWKDAPVPWFSSIEAQFMLRGVTDKVTQYYHTVAKLEPNMCAEMQDVLAKPVDARSFEELRKALIEAYDKSPGQKMEQLLGINDLGDRKPTELLGFLKRLGAGQTMEDVYRRILTRSLPTDVRTSVGESMTTSLDDFARAANKA